jgi:hypothetical protein
MWGALMRVMMGIGAGLILLMMGYIVYAAVMWRINLPPSEPAPHASSTARTLEGRLDFAMTDQEITDEAAKLKGSILELDRMADETVVLVMVPAEHPGPSTKVCYRFTLRNDAVPHHSGTACPDAAPTS